MQSKNILLSKTFWVQVSAVVSLAVPQVRGWLDANPEQFVAVLAAVNVIVRFVTSGKVSIFGAGNDSGSGTNGAGGSSGEILPLLILGTTAGLLGCLPSCAPSVDFPVRVGIQAPRASVSYDDAEGLSVHAVIVPEK